ncbi:hypothetical protein MJH12_00150 [bacterium]|nr:hypothetical protein [bacterium]
MNRIFKIIVCSVLLSTLSYAGKTREISPQFQARLIRMYLGSMKKEVDAFTLGIVSDDPEKSRKLKRALTKKEVFKINHKEVEFEVLLLDEASQSDHADAYFFYDNYHKVDDKLSFVQSSKLVNAGATIGFELKETIPKVFINIDSLRNLGIIYPLDLLRFATILGGK